MSNRKVLYALYLDSEKNTIDIENKTGIFGDTVRRYGLLTEDKQTHKWNASVYLSYSKKLLKEKAKEVRDIYIKDIKEKIAELQADIERLEAMNL